MTKKEPDQADFLMQAVKRVEENKTGNKAGFLGRLTDVVGSIIKKREPAENISAEEAHDVFTKEVERRQTQEPTQADYLRRAMEEKTAKKGGGIDGGADKVLGVINETGDTLNAGSQKAVRTSVEKKPLLKRIEEAKKRESQEGKNFGGR